MNQGPDEALAHWAKGPRAVDHQDAPPGLADLWADAVLDRKKKKALASGALAARLRVVEAATCAIAQSLLAIANCCTRADAEENTACSPPPVAGRGAYPGGGATSVLASLRRREPLHLDIDLPPAALGRELHPRRLHVHLEAPVLREAHGREAGLQVAGAAAAAAARHDGVADTPIVLAFAPLVVHVTVGAQHAHLAPALVGEGVHEDLPLAPAGVVLQQHDRPRRSLARAPRQQVHGRPLHPGQEVRRGVPAAAPGEGLFVPPLVPAEDVHEAGVGVEGDDLQVGLWDRVVVAVVWEPVVRGVQLGGLGPGRVPVPVELPRGVRLPVDAKLRPRAGAEGEGVVVAVIVVPQRRQPGDLEQRGAGVVRTVGRGPAGVPGLGLDPRPVEVVPDRPHEQQAHARVLLLGRVLPHGLRHGGLALARRPRGAPVAEEEEVVLPPGLGGPDPQRVVSVVEERVAVEAWRRGVVERLQRHRVGVRVSRRGGARAGDGSGRLGAGSSGGDDAEGLPPASVHVVFAAITLVRAVGVALARVLSPLQAAAVDRARPRDAIRAGHGVVPAAVPVVATAGAALARVLAHEADAAVRSAARLLRGGQDELRARLRAGLAVVRAATAIDDAVWVAPATLSQARAPAAVLGTSGGDPERQAPARKQQPQTGHAQRGDAAARPGAARRGGGGALLLRRGGVGLPEPLLLEEELAVRGHGVGRARRPAPRSRLRVPRRLPGDLGLRPRAVGRGPGQPRPPPVWGGPILSVLRAEAEELGHREAGGRCPPPHRGRGAQASGRGGCWAGAGGPPLQG
mmetsp:Transcript_107772/g.292164  ORF Transcript_107772/g.292164 Transcript_107772/m.292164 type:complete len:799 (+) Transcript_107772:54-2450(+)